MDNKGNSKLTRAVRMVLALAMGTVGIGAAVHAAEEETAELERVQVTGSRLTRTNLETATPVYILDREAIRNAGYQRIEDVLNTLPQLEAAQTAFVSNGATHTAELDLRGLGPDRTLVLINGRRLPPGGHYSESADVNQVPAALIERVEILTGGGSSVYGADAVAGVVNFILRTDFDGVEISADWSGYQHGNGNDYIQDLMDSVSYDYPNGSSGTGGRARSIDALMGGEFADGKGHATAYVSWRKVNAMLQAERDYSSCALNGSGTGCGGSANAPNPNFFIYPYVTDPDTGDYVVDYTREFFATLTPENGLAEFSGNFYNYAPVNYFQRPDERYSIGAQLGYELNRYVQPYIELGFMTDKSRAQIAESGTFFDEEFMVSLSDPQLSSQQVADLRDYFGLPATGDVAMYIGKRNVEGGGRVDVGTHNSHRFVIGTKGDAFGDWEYDLYLLKSGVESSTAYINDFFGPRVNEAIGFDGSCTGGCIPYEVLRFGGVTAEAATYVQGTGIMTGSTGMEVLSGYVTGDLPFGLPTAGTNVAAVFGIERREESFVRTVDEVFEKGLLLGQGGPTAGITGSYDVNELFTEFNVPLIDGAMMARSLALELGARHSDYSTSGGELTYKVAIDWMPTEMLKVRGALNRAIRGAKNGELYLPQTKGLWSGVDPCAGSTPEFTQEQCANTGVSADMYGSVGESPAGQYNQLSGGNPVLSPEIADSVTLGLVMDVTSDLSFTLDYWKVEITDAIGTIGAETIVRQCGLTGDATFCDLVDRGPGGSLWLGSGIVENTNLNLGEEVTSGIDWSMHYAMVLAGGRFDLRWIGTHLLDKETTAIPSLPDTAVDCVGIISSQCFPSPKLRSIVSATFSRGDWAATSRVRYIGAVEYPDQTDKLLVNGGVAAQVYVDLVGTYHLGDHFSASFGINNVADKEPPMMGNTVSTNANTVVGFYDSLGRMVHANVTLKY